jgi:hypothetical protein
MGSDPAITVEVTVSEELRRLLVALRGGKPLKDPATDPTADLEPEPGGHEPVLRAKSAEAPFWPEVKLRRDGQHPIIFRGLPVLTRSCKAQIPPGTAEQRLTVYLAEEELLYASLTFEPPQTACAHPSYRCQPIRDRSEFEAFLKAWHPELSFETVFATDAQQQQNLAAGQIAVRSAFNTMAADCLCKGVLHS